MVDRYDIEETSSQPYQSWRDMVKHEDGDWVRYEDYAELEAENERLHAILDNPLTSVQASPEAIADLLARVAEPEADDV